MGVDGYRELERMLREFGLQQIQDLATSWQSHGFGPSELAQWLTAGVGVDEPQLAAALAAAEWTPAEAGRTIAHGSQTLVEVARQHPDRVRPPGRLRSLAV